MRSALFRIVAKQIARHFTPKAYHTTEFNQLLVQTQRDFKAILAGLFSQPLLPQIIRGGYWGFAVSTI
uniref:Uncharacterized protein n=1 Tax=Tolypothrix bouteillei VB521301 TaxID=1479485 RepID=A0A0C1NBH5_9CYAN